MASEYFILVFFKLLILGLGSATVYATYGASRRMESKMMLWISIGFGLLTLGSVVEGILFEFLKYSLLEVHIVESLVVLAGLLTIIYSLTEVSKQRRKQ